MLSQPRGHNLEYLFFTIIPEYLAHTHSLTQFLLALRAQVAQGHMTQQQALERLAMMQASSAPPFQDQSAPQQLQPGFNAGQMPSGTTQQQIASLSQRAQVSANNPALQRALQGQDPSHARQFSMLLPHAQQQQNGSGLASRIGQNLNTPGMSLPQGPGSLQQNFIQPSPSLPHANPQPSSAASASQPPQPGAQQVPGPANLAAMSLPQLRSLSSQLLQIVMESEKNLPAAGSSGESDIQRQIRLKVENNKRYLRMLQEIISTRTRAR